MSNCRVTALKPEGHGQPGQRPMLSSLKGKLKNATKILNIFSQSVSGTLDRPRVVVLQDLRSRAILHAGVVGVEPSVVLNLLHPRSAGSSSLALPLRGLMSGLPPVPASTARRSAEWGGVASGSRRTWPEMESRLRQIRIAKPSSPVWLVTEAFVTKWNQRIPKIRRWQFMWNASNRCSSVFKRVHVWEPQYWPPNIGHLLIDATALWDPWDWSPPTLEDEGTKGSCPPPNTEIKIWTKVQIFISFYQKCLIVL